MQTANYINVGNLTEGSKQKLLLKTLKETENGSK